jgi:hypothetical protein
MNMKFQVLAYAINGWCDLPVVDVQVNDTLDEAVQDIINFLEAQTHGDDGDGDPVDVSIDSERLKADLKDRTDSVGVYYISYHRNPKYSDDIYKVCRFIRSGFRMGGHDEHDVRLRQNIVDECTENALNIMDYVLAAAHQDAK